MRNLGDTLARLAPKVGSDHSGSSRLSSFAIQGPNPGGLKAWAFVPDDLPDDPALVVVLHGCTQTAAAYDAGSGWSALGERYGFIVVYPEQQRTNNPGLCFNWYASSDTRRGEGEAASISSAAETVIQQHHVDRSRVFVTGLSAGGAMTSVMLATYPEVFAGGAIIAGLPYGSATSVPEAFDRMRGHGLPTASASTAAVLTASGHTGPWPSISIWHGAADHTVAPANADALVAQWAGVHDLGPVADETTSVSGHTHRVWRDATGGTMLEDYRISGMDHGVPIDTRGAEPCGKSGPYMLEAGISSTRQLVRHWRLDAVDGAAKTAPTAPQDKAANLSLPAAPSYATSANPQPPITRVQTVIEDALKRAGLMR